MSMERVSVGVPEFDLADRMRKALRTSGVSVQEIADYLGVARNTVSTWINGRITPSVQTVRLWSLKTGVPYEWLATGAIPSDNGPSPTDGSTLRSRHASGTDRDETVVNLRALGDAPGAMRTTRTAAA